MIFYQSLRRNAVGPAVWVIALAMQMLAPSPAYSQASPSPFTAATRYDAMHRVVGTIAPDPDGANSLNYGAVRNSYDGAGRLIKVEKGELLSWQSETVAPANWPNFNIYQIVETVYDSQSRKVRETVTGYETPAGQSAGYYVKSLTQYSYDADGNLECTAVRMNPAVYSSLPVSACTPTPQGTSGADQITRNNYDVAGQLVQVRKGIGSPMESADATYSYTPTGKREYVIDGEGNRAQFAYDGHDRVLEWRFPSTTRPGAYNDSTQASALASAGSVNTVDREQYAYDLNGNRTTLTKRDGKVLTYQYDGLDRMTVKLIPDQDGFDPTYTTGDVYYGYDAEGHMTFARFNSTSGQGITNTWDGFGELKTMTNTLIGKVLTYDYDVDGNRTRITHPDGVYFDTQFDGLDRPYNANWYSTTTASTWWLVTLSYDPLGRRHSMNLANSLTVYDYDGASRLTSLSHSFAAPTDNITEGFAYSPAGQITSESRDNDAFAWTGSVAVSRAYTTNGLNQYSAAGSQSFSYDPNGNLISDGTYTYAYDPENRLVWTSRNNTALFYDPMGRLWRTSPGTNYLYDGDNLAMEFDDTGPTRRYFFGPNTDEPLMVDSGGMNCTTSSFMHADHQGSVIAYSGCGAGRSAVNKYDEYGIPQTDGSGRNVNTGRFQYTGQAWIDQLGMYYYKARMYSPTLGRFMQTDPVGYDDQLNLYEYATDDPLDNTDPHGETVRFVGTRTDFDSVKGAVQTVWNASPALRQRLTQLMNSQYQHTIRFGEVIRYQQASGVTTPLVTGPLSKGGSGTTIDIDNLYKSGVDSLGRDLATIIAHELTGHAWLDQQGANTQAMDKKTKIPVDEEKAMAAENNLNVALGRHPQSTYRVGDKVRNLPSWSVHGNLKYDPPTGTRINHPGGGY